MHDAGEYRERFTWIEERLKRLVGDAEDFEFEVGDVLGEEETSRTGCVSLAMDNGIPYLENRARLLRNHIEDIELEIKALERLVIADKIEIETRSVTDGYRNEQREG